MTTATLPEDFLETLSVIPFEGLALLALERMAGLGPVPGQPADLSTISTAIKKGIQNINAELLQAKNRDDVAAAQAKLALLKGEQSKIEAGVRATVIEGLLRGIYVCVGRLDGRLVVVPASDWAGDVDWTAETLSAGTRHYRRLRAVDWGKLSPEQKTLVTHLLSGEPTSTAPRTADVTTNVRHTSGFPGRPSSRHLVEAEFKRRSQAGELEPSLEKEAAALERWLSETHPGAPRARKKTIQNAIRELYRPGKKPER